MANERQSPERTVASPPRAATPLPTLASEPIINLDTEGTSASTRDSTRPDPPKELEKEKDGAKTPIAPSQKPDPRPTPKAPEKRKQQLLPKIRRSSTFLH